MANTHPATHKHHALAERIARLMVQDNMHDIDHAKRKFARKHGISNLALLPDNAAIHAAWLLHRQLFAHNTQAQLDAQRKLALQAMDFFQPFAPRLVGAVLDGSATAETPICLHLHSDDATAVALFLQQQQIPAQAKSRRIALSGRHSQVCDVWQFQADGHFFELVVLPMQAVRQAPISGIDNKPMARASIAQLQALLESENSARSAV